MPPSAAFQENGRAWIGGFLLTSIWEQVEVLDNHERLNESFIVFAAFALSPTSHNGCRQPQRSLTPKLIPATYSLQAWTTTGFLSVTRGEPVPDGLLRIRHRKTLTFALQPPKTSSEDTGMTDGDDGGEGHLTTGMTSATSACPGACPGVRHHRSQPTAVDHQDDYPERRCQHTGMTRNPGKAEFSDCMNWRSHQPGPVCPKCPKDIEIFLER